MGSNTDSSEDKVLNEINLPGHISSGDPNTNESNNKNHPLMNKVKPLEPGLENKSLKMEEETQLTSFSTKEGVDDNVNPFNNYSSAVVQPLPKGNYLNSPFQRGDTMQKAEELKLEHLDPDEQSLHQIAKDGDIILMQAVLNQYTPLRAVKKLNKRDADKFTPLHYAARYNHYRMCELLVERGAKISSLGEDDMTALHLVAKFKPKPTADDHSDTSSEDDGVAQQEANLRVLDFFIGGGADVNGKDFYGLTAMHYASYRGNLPCVKRLLECPGINFEATDKQLMTPLHYAAVYGHVEIAAEFIKVGANIRCRDNDNGTPLQFAAAEGNLQIVQLIFDHFHADSRAIQGMLENKDNDGSTPLHLCVDNGHLNVTQHIIDTLLAFNLNKQLNARRGNRETPLHLASKHGHLALVKMLLENGAKIDVRDESLSTPLILAAQYDHSMVVEHLIKQGANIELHDTDNFTALLIAANYGHTATISVLLNSKANVAAVDKNDKGVVYQCAEEGREDALQLFLKRKKVRSLLENSDRYGDTPLHVAAMKGNFSILKILLDAGAVIDSKNEDEQTPLHLAATNGRAKIIQELISRKKEIVHDDDEAANTPLHLAALSGRVHCVRELVRLGASIGARNAKQWTPLDCCASAGMYKSAIVLLEADSPVDPKDKRKVTPLHLACQEGHPEMVEVLINWNADVSSQSVDGNNALDFAIDYGHSDCAQVLVTSEKWREVMRNRTLDRVTDQYTKTPMRKLIEKMPKVAEMVFRQCLRHSEKFKDDRKYWISFDYEFLDDEYSCTHWLENDDSTSELNVPITDGTGQIIMGSAAYERDYDGKVTYDDAGKITPEAEPYSKDSSVLVNNHPLSIMVKSKRENLLRHPLVVSLLNHKWKSYGRVVYYSNLMVYVLFMAVLNSYMLTAPPPYAINSTTTVFPYTCVFVRDVAIPVWGSACQPNYSGYRLVSTYIIIILAGIGLLKELYQLMSRRLSYFVGWTNLLELALYTLSILLVIDVTEFSRLSGIRENWQWECGAAALFFSWMGLLLFIQNFPKFGIFVLMFSDVFKTFISFAFVFALFVLGFSFSFHVLLQNQFSFDRWWKSIIKTFVMMIGEFEYTSIFDAESTSSDYSDQLTYEVVTYLLFFVFMIIMSIIIMNLLVGLAVDDIKEVQDNAELESLAMQVKLALDVEYTLPQFVRRGFLRKFRLFYPNMYRARNQIVRWFYSEDHLNNKTIHETLNPDENELQELKDKVASVNHKVKLVKSSLSAVNDRTKVIENMSAAIIKHFKLTWEKNEEDDD